MAAYEWSRDFRAVYDHALRQYQAGNRDAQTYFTAEERAFLSSIGCKPAEVLDFAEDAAELDWETALLITSVRRAHFLFVEGAPSRDFTIGVKEFPPKDAEIDGIPWLPRLIMKANAKLRGQLPDELMYCCGGDRAFFKKYDIHPADFLRLAWYAEEDHRKIVEFVKARG